MKNKLLLHLAILGSIILMLIQCTSTTTPKKQEVQVTPITKEQVTPGYFPLCQRMP